MNIQEYLDSFFKGTKNPSLDAMKYFMDEFDHPERKLKFVHIAGTNGKGSCTEMISNVLINAGYKVGKFLSPHLVKYNERISVQNENITDEEMEELISIIRPKIDKYNLKNDINVTLFELETTMALLYFEKKKCDIVVLETGLGGLYDCTNVVEPLVSVISSIGYDHMHILGNTLPEIAFQKAGIIKKDSDTVYIEQKEADVNKVILDKCNMVNNNLHTIKQSDVKNFSYDEDFLKFDFKKYKNVLVNLKGIKQIGNACICLETIDVLNSKGFNISDESIREGLKTVVHKGRFELLSKNPTIVFDGAHNDPAIDNFINSVDMYYKNEKKVYVISILKTKDYKAILKELLKNNKSTFIFTSGLGTEKYVSKGELLEFASEISENDNLYSLELDEAINTVKNKYSDCVSFIVGSFYVYGKIINLLTN